MALWVWKAQLGVLLGLLLLRESTLPCDCMMQERDLEEEAKLKDFVKDSATFDVFFPAWIDIDQLQQLPLFGDDGDDGDDKEFDFLDKEFGTVAVTRSGGKHAAIGVSSAPDANKDVGVKDLCFTIVGSKWDDIVEQIIQLPTGSTIKRHDLKTNRESIYRVLNSVKNGKPDCKNRRLRTVLLGEQFAFDFTKGIFGGLGRTLQRMNKQKMEMTKKEKFDAVENIFVLGKVLVSKEKVKSVSSVVNKDEWTDGDGLLHGVYRLAANGRLARKGLLQARWENVRPYPSEIPTAKRITVEVLAEAFDVWIYDDDDPEKEPQRISEGKHTIKVKCSSTKRKIREKDKETQPLKKQQLLKENSNQPFKKGSVLFMLNSQKQD